MRRPPLSTLFPYTTLFRSPSARRHALEAQGVEADAIVGVSGLERAFDDRLRGTPGGELLATRRPPDRKSTRLNSSHANISYAVFCLKKKKKETNDNTLITS